MTIATFTLVLSLTGVSMSLWNITYTQSDTNTIVSGCFSIDFEDENPIILTNTYPISDVKGLTTAPYTFTLENTCSLASYYYITLDIVDATTNMALSKVKVNLDKGTSEILGSLDENTDISDPLGIRSSYIIGQGSLNSSATKSHNLRIWVDELAGNDTMTKNLEARVTIVANAVPDS